MRTAFLVDGFNLYHSLREAARDNNMGRSGTKWLNISSFCTASLHLINKNAKISFIHYFSALAKHIKPQDVHLRHRTFIEALEHTGVDVHLGRFKSKEVYCSKCKSFHIRYEEKETDVAIAVMLTRLCLLNDVDTVVLITGDTDVAPAVRMVKSCCPEKKIWFCFPYKRKNNELVKLSDGHFSMTLKSIRKHQFPESVNTGMKTILKPEKW